MPRPPGRSHEPLERVAQVARGIQAGVDGQGERRIIHHHAQMRQLEISRIQPGTVRIDTPVELDQFRSGGILPFVLRKLLAT